MYRSAFILVTALVLAAASPALAATTGSAAQRAMSGRDARGHFLAVPLSATRGFTYARLREGVQFRVKGITKNVLFYGPDTVRVNSTLGANYWTAPSLVVIKPPALIPFSVNETAATLTVIPTTSVRPGRSGSVNHAAGRPDKPR